VDSLDEHGFPSAPQGDKKKFWTLAGQASIALWYWTGACDRRQSPSTYTIV